MRKSLLSKIILLAGIYCIAFFFLVILQFSNKGSFSLNVGGMTIRGRYSDTHQIDQLPGSSHISGGIRVFFGGLEFGLNEVRGKGLTLIENNRQIAVNPETLQITENTARFSLPNGTVISFSALTTERGQELIISADFSGDAQELIIPITPRRSSIVRDEDRLGIMYSGLRYLFGSGGNELENRSITLTRESSLLSYRSRARQTAFDPANYIIVQANNYESTLLNWIEENYLSWNQNAAALQSEYDIIGFLTEALNRRNYNAAVASVSRYFLNNPGHSFRSSPFIGGMANAHRTLVALETSRLNTINALLREKSVNILKEENILDYLFTRSNTAAAYEVVDIIQSIQPEMITIDICPGLLEVIADLRRWRPAANNPVNDLINQILSVISENLVRENNFVFASNTEGQTLDFSMRLGKALIDWAEPIQNTEWLAIGRSLVLSCLLNESSDAGKFYNVINSEANYPKAVWLMDNGLWAWTSASSVRASNINGDITLSFNFPVNMTHHVIIRGVRPFNRIQIHGTDWRSDSQFERYDSSGWFYYPQDQILVLKLRHREAVENVRIIYRAPVAAPVPVAAPEPAEEEAN